MKKILKVLNVPAPLWLVFVIFGLTANAQPYYRNFFGNGGTVDSGNVIQLPDGTAGAPSLGIGDNYDTGFFRRGDGEIGFSSNGTEKWYFRNFYFGGGSALIYNSTGAASTPTYSMTSCGTCGMYQTGGNLSFSVTAAQVAVLEAKEDLGAGETSLWIYDDDNDTVEQVTVGAADSGGSGYKLLRILN